MPPKEIFRFGQRRCLHELQMALGDPARSAQTKAAVVPTFCPTGRRGNRGCWSTVGRLHGQRLDAAIGICTSSLRQRERVVAEVRVAAP